MTSDRLLKHAGPGIGPRDPNRSGEWIRGVVCLVLR